MDSYPLTTKFIEQYSLPNEHYLSQISETDPILPAIEYFLSLKHVDGFDSKVEEIVHNPINDRKSNNGIVGWASLCAEFGAIRLLGKELHISIIGFNQNSPKADDENSNCDVKTRYENTDLFFEVKRNSKSDTQSIPDELFVALNNIDCSYSLTPQLLNRQYKSKDLEEVVFEIEKHIEKFERMKDRGLCRNEDAPWPYTNDNFYILFAPKEESEPTCDGSYLDPPSVRDICSYLLATDKIGKNGKPMVPMVEQARDKGADYLICRIPSWGSFETIVKECFEKTLEHDKKEFVVEDSRMSGMKGIILFNKYDEFCLINNGNLPKDLLIQVKA